MKKGAKNIKILQIVSIFFKKTGNFFKIIQNNSILLGPFLAFLASIWPIYFRKKIFLAGIRAGQGVDRFFWGGSQPEPGGWVERVPRPRSQGIPGLVY